jgi:hypothetical protein
MTTVALTTESRTGRAARLRIDALSAAARLWFASAVIGQWMFLYYIVVFYFPSTLTGNFQAWNLNRMLINGYVAGDTAGNLAFAGHVLMAAVITFGGTVQLVPRIRARWPAVHRWSGRAFLITAMGASLAGLYMTWWRHPSGLAGQVAISLDAALILSFAVLAWRKALARDFASHRRWAMRAFMVANAVWFLRVGFVPIGAVAKLMGGELGLDSPVIVAWQFGCYLVPLAILELYFRAGAGARPAGRLAMAGGLVAVTLLMSAGIAGAWFAMFAPTLAKL